LQEKVEDIHMMEEEEAATEGVQAAEAVLLQMEDHLHIALVEGHQMAGHLHVVQMEDHQTEQAVLQELEVADHLPPTREEAMEDLIARHQKEEVVPQVADVDVKKVVLPIDKFSQDYAN
jgi:hypothetical protein